MKIFRRNNKLANKYVSGMLMQKTTYKILTVFSWVILIAFLFISIEYILHLEVLGMTIEEACNIYFPLGLIPFGIWGLAVTLKNIFFIKKYIPSTEEIILDIKNNILIYKTEDMKTSIDFSQLKELLYIQKEHIIKIISKEEIIETYDYFDNIRELFTFFSLELKASVKAI